MTAPLSERGLSSIRARLQADRDAQEAPEELYNAWVDTINDRRLLLAHVDHLTTELQHAQESLSVLLPKSLRRTTLRETIDSVFVHADERADARNAQAAELARVRAERDAERAASLANAAELVRADTLIGELRAERLRLAKSLIFVHENIGPRSAWTEEAEARRIVAEESDQ
jgi:hypothetical protein